MNRTNRIFLWLALLLSCVSLAHAQIIVDYTAPPADMEGLVANSATVIRGVVEGNRPDNPPPDKGPRETVYTVRVLEILKGDDRFKAGDAIDVHRHGSVGADAMFAHFQTGDELVLFLERRRDGRYMPIWGPDGSFRLQDGRAQAFGRSALSERYDGAETATFLFDVMRAASR